MEILVHGGAGGSPDDPQKRQAVLDDAAADGAAATDALSAVERAVRVLESSPMFNAGVGSAVQSDGKVRTDAGVMTSDRAAGCVCSMPGVEHAVSAARVVLEETPHVLLSGEQAVDLAAAFGVETGVDLWTERSRERWAEADAPARADAGTQLSWVRERFGGRDTGESDDPTDHDTVGAVARNGDDFAAATSTGGRWFALAGRVGDVPQIGSGVYCNGAGAASATGAGEDIARLTLTRRAVAHLEAGATASAAASQALAEFERHAPDASAGLIVVGPEGIGSAYNSDAMQTATGDE